MRVAAWIAAAGALGGCDTVFRLNGSDDQGSGADARIDASLADGLVAWYPMDHGGPTLEDATGNGNTGTCTVACPTETTGILGGALDFDGAEESYLIAPQSDLETANAFTQTEWIKIRSYRAQVTCPVSKIYAPGADANSWQGCIAQDGAVDYISSFVSDSLMGDELFSANHLALDRWYHLAFVWNGMFKSTYVDGVFDSSRADTVTFAGGGIGIGADFDTVGIVGMFDGQIDDVRIYDRALTPIEIATLHRLGAP